MFYCLTCGLRPSDADKAITDQLKDIAQTEESKYISEIRAGKYAKLPNAELKNPDKILAVLESQNLALEMFKAKMTQDIDNFDLNTALTAQDGVDKIDFTIKLENINLLKKELRPNAEQYYNIQLEEIKQKFKQLTERLGKKVRLDWGEAEQIFLFEEKQIANTEKKINQTKKATKFETEFSAQQSLLSTELKSIFGDDFKAVTCQSIGEEITRLKSELKTKQAAINKATQELNEESSKTFFRKDDKIIRLKQHLGDEIPQAEILEKDIKKTTEAEKSFTTMINRLVGEGVEAGLFENSANPNFITFVDLSKKVREDLNKYKTEHQLSEAEEQNYEKYQKLSKEIARLKNEYRSM